MYVIGIITLLIYGGLWLVSREMQIQGKGVRPMARMAAWIYEKVSEMAGESMVQGRNLAKLEKLYPGKEAKQLLWQYYVEKLSLVLTVILAGTMLATVISLQAEGERRLRGGSVVERGNYLEPKQQLQLNASVEGYPEQTFSLWISGQVPDKEAVDQLEEQFWEVLKETALSKNASWDSVCEELMLKQRLENYPFDVEWSSERPHILDDEGNVKALSRGEKEKVTLKAKITYYQWEWLHTLDVTVITALTEEELFYQELEQLLIGQEEESRQEAGMVLPDVWQGKEIRWKEQLENHGLTLWVLAMAAGAGIFFLKDKDLDTQLQERQKQLRDAYPGILHKLELYLGAGLTTRGAFVRIAEEYLQKRKEGKAAHPAYEEILHTYRELGLGMVETKVYERFGSRCGTQEYVRLGALLSQNVKKGSRGLAIRLREEAEEARKEQMQHSRQLGEEASTKLLVPMVMMLGIVMVLIMIPAFGSF